MDPTKPKRLVLTSVNQLITLARTNPQLVSAMPKLEPLVKMDLSTAPKKSCNCGSKVNWVSPDANKQTTEMLLSSLQLNDFVGIKNALNLNELCYYKRSDSEKKLELICV
jgi:hypothetical protein